jgi:Kef-type K+ transport system membrane component KefB
MNTEKLLFIVIVQLIVIIAAARAFGSLFQRMGQPRVCGEMAAGLILGPSLFGGLFPGLFHRIFDPAVSQSLGMMSQLGLILLMFLIGLEFDFSHLNDNRRLALWLSIAGIVAPFGLGFVLGGWMHAALNLGGNWLNFALFTATALSITAIPTLGRIMIELNIHRTRLGTVIISAAAVNDAAGWIILALVSSIARSSVDPGRTVMMIVGTLLFAGVAYYIVRPVAIRWTTADLERSQGELTPGTFTALLLLVLLAAVATNWIGIFSIFGPFVLGAVLHDQLELAAAIRRRLQDFVTVFFLPIFFTYTGLRTEISSMSGGREWLFCGLVLAAAIVGKAGGSALAARANGVPWRDASLMGALMNTRGLMELIVINLGFELGIIPSNVFFMLVLMAVVTTYMTAPLVRFVVRGSEVEHEYAPIGVVPARR